jgi:hypothetical protein
MIMILCEGVEIHTLPQKMEIAQVLTRAYEFNMRGKYLRSTGTFGATGISSEERRCSRLSASGVNLALSDTRRWIPTRTFPPA